jgi:hypothetical protein
MEYGEAGGGGGEARHRGHPVGAKWVVGMQVVPNFRRQLLRLIHGWLGVANVHVSIYENGAVPRAPVRPPCPI